MALTFDFLTPKPYQFIFVPRRTGHKDIVKSYQWIPEILLKQSLKMVFLAHTAML